MGNPIIFQALAVLMILFFFFLTYMCSKTWRIFHVLVLFALFGVSCWFVCISALVLKTQYAWRQKHKQLVDQLAAETEKGLLLEYGDPATITAWNKVDWEGNDNVRIMRGRLNRFLLDQGRVWRHCRPSFANNTITVNTSPEGTPADQQQDHRIKPGDVLYVFEETQTPEGLTVANYYLGEFQVDAATKVEVTLRPFAGLDGDQMRKIQATANATVTWAMYEMMPIDSHWAFGETAPDDTRLFGSPNQERVQQMFKDIAAERAAEILNDGKRLDDEGMVNTERIWYRVRFLQDATVDVDSGDTQAVLKSNYFDTNGLAIVQRLRRGEMVKEDDGTLTYNAEPAEFSKDDEAIFDKATADRLAEEGVLEKVTPFYVRKLNDYELEFRHVALRTREIARQAAHLRRTTAQIQAAIKQVSDQSIYRQGEKDKLEKDLASYQKEVTVLTALLEQQLEPKYKNMVAELSSLYRTNHALAAELKVLHGKAAEAINRRTENATAGLP